MVTAPAMNGMIGGRRNTISEATSATRVVPTSDQTPASTPKAKFTMNIVKIGPISLRMLSVCSPLNGYLRVSQPMVVSTSPFDVAALGGL